MESKTVQNFKGIISLVKNTDKGTIYYSAQFDDKGVFYSTEYLLEKVEEKFGEFYNIENGKEYALLVSVNESKKAYSTAFASTLMGLILTKNPDKNCGFTCNIEKSKDNKNHFRVFKTKG